MPALNNVVNFVSSREGLWFPFSGAGVNVPIGTPVMAGTAAGTNLGVLIPITASSNAKVVGFLAEQHVFAITGDATTAGTVAQWFFTEGFNIPSTAISLGSPAFAANLQQFPSHRVTLVDSTVIVRMDYAINTTFTGQAATAMTVTSMTGSTVINNGSFQSNFDSAFVYFVAGTAIGELGFIKSSVASTSATLTSALTTTPVAADTMILINPLFYQTPTWLVNNTTVTTLIDSNVAAGTGRATQLMSWINRNGIYNRLDPKVFHNTQKLNSLNMLGFTGYLQFQNTIFHPTS